MWVLVVNAACWPSGSTGCSGRLRDRGEQRRAVGAVAKGLGSQDAALDEHALDREAVHLGVAGNGALLHVEALTLVGLGDSADPSVAECAAGQGRMAR